MNVEVGSAPAAPIARHFDRWETLSAVLESYGSEPPPQPSVAEYLAWDDDTRRMFDQERVFRIVNRVAIATPQLQELRVEARRAFLLAQRDIGRTGILVSGPATMGKTTACFFALLDAFRKHVGLHPGWRELNHIPVVYIEVPSECTPKALMGRFLDFFDVLYTSRTTQEERTQLVIEHLQNRRTSMVVFDELHNLARLRNGDFSSAQAIKNLLNGVRAVPIYAGVNLEDTALVNGILGAQFAGRSTLVTLGPLQYDTEEDRLLWAGVIHSFEQQLRLLAHPPKTLFPHAERLWYLTRGSIGALSRLLTLGALELIDAGDAARERLTMTQLASIKVDLATARKIDGES